MDVGIRVGENNPSEAYMMEAYKLFRVETDRFACPSEAIRRIYTVQLFVKCRWSLAVCSSQTDRYETGIATQKLWIKISH